MLLVFAITASSGNAKTLIVTHPQAFFDTGRVAGSATRELLQDPSFNRKIVLYTSSGNGEFTFSPVQLKFETRVSYVGEFNLDFNDSDFTFAGGFWSACLSKTLQDFSKIILRGSNDLIIRFKMDAIYMHSRPAPVTMSQFFTTKQSIGKAMENGILDIPDFVSMQPERRSVTPKVRVFKDGQLQQRWGTGSRTITFIFE